MADRLCAHGNGRPPAVFAMQYGPGAENAFPGIASAYSDSTPVLLLPLGHPRDIAQVFPMFKSTRTYAIGHEVGGAADAAGPGRARDAPRVQPLKNGRLGPVMVEVPADVVKPELGTETVAYEPVRAARSGGDPRDIDDAAKLLLEAQGARCSIAGQGVLYAEASAELLGARRAAAGSRHDVGRRQERLPRGPSAGSGHRRHRLHRPRPAFSRTTPTLCSASAAASRRTASPAPIIAASASASSTPPTTRAISTRCTPPTSPILGDAKLVLAAAARGREAIASARRRAAGARRRRSPGCGRVAGDAGRPSSTSNERPINPYRVISEFMRVVDPKDAIVTHDSAVRAIRSCRSTRRRSRAATWAGASRISSAPGSASPSAPRSAAPDKFCVNFMGDAAFGMTGLDFETAVRSGVPILTIVLNNSTMAIEIPHMKLSHEKHSTRDLGGNYAAHRHASSAAGASASTIPAQVGRRDPPRAPADGGRAAPACSSSSPAPRPHSRTASSDARKVAGQKPTSRGSHEW